MRAYTSEGIVLARKSFSEADRIVAVYSKDRGLVKVVAKGVRRPLSRKRGHLEVFSVIKFQVSQGRGMGIMTEVETTEGFDSVRKSLPRVSLAYFFLEAVGKITHEGEKNPEIYNLLLKSLEKLKTQTDLKSLRLDFLKDLLVAGGYWPKDKEIPDPDAKFEEISERTLNSLRVGKRLFF